MAYNPHDRRIDGYDPPPNWMLEKRMRHGSGLIFGIGFTVLLVVLVIAAWKCISHLT